MFCMLLRKYCESGVIEAVEQIGMERVIRFQIRHRDELGDISPSILLWKLWDDIAISFFWTLQQKRF